MRKKSHVKKSWKEQGILWLSNEEFNEIYERYLLSDKCELCGNEYKNSQDKNLDHEHCCGKYGWFRNIICMSCNQLRDQTLSKRNTSGHRNIHTEFKRGKEIWRLRIQLKHKSISRTFDKSKYSIEDVVLVKNEILKNLQII
jgi:hypothetical protein